MKESFAKSILAAALAALLLGSIFVTAFTMSRVAFAQVAEEPSSPSSGSADSDSPPTSNTSSDNSTSSTPEEPPASDPVSENSTSSAPSEPVEPVSNSTDTSAPSAEPNSSSSSSESAPPAENVTSSDAAGPIEVTVSLEHSEIEINSPVSWVQTVTLSDQAEILAVELPADAQDVTVATANGQNVDFSAIVEGSGSADAVATLDGISEVLQDNAETMLVAIEEPATGYDVSYETDAPYTIETENSSHELYQKEVTVTHDSELHYTEVKSYSDIPEEMVLQGTSISLFWMVNGERTDVTSDERFGVTLVDTDSNGIADQMQWIVPQLSEQQFVIEVIIPPTNAEHFDSNGNFIEDVYDQVIERDGTWTNEIQAGDFIRVIFEQPLSNGNDITIFARSSLNGTVEVYEKDSNVLIATFDMISADGMYRIYLSNLPDSQDTFDLKVVDNAVEFDKIVDPTITVTLSPIADVSRSLWTSLGTATGCTNTSHFACVDEAPPRTNNDGTGSLFEFNGANANDRFDIANGNIPSSAAITSVVLHVVADKASGGTGNIILRVITPSSSNVDLTLGAPNNFNSELVSDVTAARSWVPADFNGQITDIAVLTPASGNNRNVRVTQMWLEVTYVIQTISGTKFNDLNGNGALNGGEPGLSGWTIFLDADNDGNLDAGETSTVTDMSGIYQFTNLATGTYKVREVAQAGWTQTTSNPADVVLTSGLAASGVNFGNFQLITITGKKFNDLDGDGTDDGGTDPGLSGWTIQLDKDANGSVDATTTTGAGGTYSFTGLGPGTYRIREVAQSGWTQTTANPTDATASSGTNVGNKNFGNFQQAVISGKKLIDTNGDGILQAGETTPVSGVIIFLDTNNNGILNVGETSTTTDGTGAYSFSVGLGTYKVREVVPAGSTRTTANPADIIVSTSGQTFTNTNFGNFVLATISGLKFVDTNGDGILQAGETTPVSGVIIFLDTDNDGVLDAGETSTTTSGTGAYSFSVAAGTYKVREVVPAGSTRTTANPADIIVSTSGQTFTSVNFGNFQLASITGKKFRDKDGNGIMDAGDNVLNGWTIFIDSDNNGALNGGEPSTTTASGGSYSFSGLSPGTYIVREVLQSGWVQTAPAAGFHSVTFTASGQTASGKDFGNFELITITGKKFNDLDGDGTDDGGTDPGLSGWTIQLDKDANGSVDATTTTGAGGTYSFTGLGPGTYRIREVAQSGWTQTTANPAAIIASSGTNVSDIDFGNFQLATISGIKFDDENGDGSRLGDTGLSGWTIYIDVDNSGTLNAGDISTITGAGGSFSFSNLGLGTYTIREDTQAGWTQTAPSSGFHSITVSTSGTTVPDVDFGNFDNVVISGVKFDDSNGDGARNAGEPGLSGWTIELLGSVSLSTVTDANGEYSFTDLGPGTYVVSEALMSGWTQTFPAAGSYSITPTSGDDTHDQDFGNFELFDISGNKFDDSDGDGIRDLSETDSVSGVTMLLDVGADGTADASTVTDSNGDYSFANLGPGTYRVREAPPSGWVQTTAEPSDISGQSGSDVTDTDFGNFKLFYLSGMKFEDHNGNGIKDSDDDGLSGWTIRLARDGSAYSSTTTASDGTYSFTELGPGVYTVSEDQETGWTQTYPDNPGTHVFNGASGVDVQNKEFGNFKLVTISGLKYEDHNGDGAQEVNDQGLEGWTINLDKDSDGSVDASTTTASDGTYSFSGLGPGTFRVREVQQSGWTQTTDNPLDITTESGVDVSGTSFGNFENIAISGLKFEDHDGDATQDPEDQGLTGWVIQLDVDADGTVDETQTTGSDGAYSFGGLGPGTYRIRESAQPDWTQTTPSPEDVVASSGIDVTGVDFGNFQLFDISGMKFEDHNGNGIKESGDQGLQGWTIGLAKNGSPFTSTTTDSNGGYSFNDLGPGIYSVSEIAQAGWTQTFPSPASHGVTGSSGVDVLDKDFGNFELIAISGKKYNDLDGDGTNDGGTDPGLSGWTIQLDKDANGSVDQTTTTAADGTYSFSGLGPSAYRVGEVAQLGWTQTSANPSDVTASSGIDVASINFGNFQLVTISGKKFHDLDGDKTSDGGTDPGLSGWTMELRNSLNVIIATAMTDASGNYQFTGVGPGSYAIKEVIDQSVWHQTLPAKYPLPPGSYPVTTSSGVNIAGKDFGNIKTRTISGFYQPIDMSGVVNIIKNGQAVPAKFKIFIGGTEQTSTSEIAGGTLTYKSVSCSTLTGASLDEVELTNTGATALRYDSTGGQYIQNWKTPSGAGMCYSLTATLIDGTSITALFKTK